MALQQKNSKSQFSTKFKNFISCCGVQAEQDESDEKFQADAPMQRKKPGKFLMTEDESFSSQLIDKNNKLIY